MLSQRESTHGVHVHGEGHLLANPSRRSTHPHEKNFAEEKKRNIFQGPEIGGQFQVQKIFLGGPSETPPCGGGVLPLSNGLCRKGPDFSPKSTGFIFELRDCGSESRDCEATLCFHTVTVADTGVKASVHGA